MTHLGYIIAAYAGTALVLGCAIVWAFHDLWAQKRYLARLEAEGRGRRSGRSQ